MNDSQPVVPIELRRDGENVIEIRWNDDKVNRWTVSELRRICPCATCREKRRSTPASENVPLRKLSLPVLSAQEARPLRIDSMQPVGSYAYNISFSDGHSSGIFPFGLLRGDES
jgi:DUF971 family protein